MVARELALTDFRNILQEKIEFSPGINIFHGANGQGKTSLLEAIHTLCFTRSFRERSDQVIQNYAGRGYEIAGVFTDEHKEFVLKAIFKEQKKKLFLNQSPIHRKSEIMGLVPVSVLTPGHLSLTLGGPVARRAYLDSVLSQVFPVYLDSLNKFKEGIRHKNLILQRYRKTDFELLSSWNTTLSANIEIINQYRQKYIDWSNDLIAGIYQQISGKQHDLKVTFEPSLPATKDAVFSVLQEAAPDEIEKAVSLLGPHRDDIEITLNNMPVRRNGSQGENKTAVITLKILEINYLRSFSKQNPIILLDDIFSELDIHRTQNLIDVVAEKGQVFITSTQAWDFLAEERQEIAYYTVIAGKVAAA
jgi:DNA replication and repair protein RecF